MCSQPSFRPWLMHKPHVANSRNLCEIVRAMFSERLREVQGGVNNI